MVSGDPPQFGKRPYFYIFFLGPFPYHEDGKLIGAVLTHVDDLILAGNEKFIERIREGIAMVLTVSKIERDKFRFTGWDIERCADGKIRVTMTDYAESMEEVKSIRKGDGPRT